MIDVQFTEGAAQSAIQYFENTRNFLVAVGEMKLLTFEASDLEKVVHSSLNEPFSRPLRFSSHLLQFAQREW